MKEVGSSIVGGEAINDVICGELWRRATILMGTVLQVFITFGACISQENVGIKCENIYFCLRDIIFFYTHFFRLSIRG